MMSSHDKILCVDDEQHVLASYRRQLRKDFDLDTASSGPEGLEAIQTNGPFAVIVSDMQMPGMNGVQFLSEARKIAPNSVRMMLTGVADQSTAAEAVNEGNVFRFLTKPCRSESLIRALVAGIEQYKLITAEKELVEKTLLGSIKVLSDVLSLVNPTAFGRASRVLRLTRELARELKVSKSWQVKIAAMLSQVGCVTVPEQTLSKVYKDADLEPSELQMFAAHPQIGSDLIARIPRLETVSEMIAYQEKKFDGTGHPQDSRTGEQIPQGARILKVALDLDTLESKGMVRSFAIAELRSRTGWYDPAVLTALETVIQREEQFLVRKVALADLDGQMILAADVKTADGVLLVSKGQEVTSSLRQLLKNFSRRSGIVEPIHVLIPPEHSLRS